MNTRASDRSGLLIALLSLTAIGLLAAVYFTPIWWVSLTAPNYPPEAFPDGVRIHFHMNGVFNGCKKVEKAEIREDEALDCVHEMDTINHYVGMYPIAAGGVLEKTFSPFLHRHARGHAARLRRQPTRPAAGRAGPGLRRDPGLDVPDLLRVTTDCACKAPDSCAP